ncbi:fungal-specific transcription factor domain-containing protein [Trichoderma sp. SZMC 28014]
MAAQRRACDACYKRKIQCDRSDPDEQCNWCLHHGLHCTINRIRGRKKKTKAKALKQSTQTASPVSASSDGSSAQQGNSTCSPSSIPSNTPITRTLSRSSESSQACSRQLGAAPLGQIWMSGQKFAAICDQNGIPRFTPLGEKYIYAQTGLWPHFHNESTFAFESTGHAASGSLIQRSPRAPADQLPEKWITNTFFDLFLQSEFRLIFPLVDRELFRGTIEQAYDAPETNPTVEEISSKACVFAFLSLSSRHFAALSVSNHVDSDGCAKQAQILIADFIDDASVTTLQVMILLLLNEALCGRLPASSMYHAIACRTVYALGGHTLISDPPDDRDLTIKELEERQIRLLFWLCYLFDKDIALRSGQPPIMSDEFCDLTLPKDYLKNRFANNLDIPQNIQKPFLPNDLRLSILKSKAVRALYSVGSLRKSDAELLHTIRELDEELENWRASIPAEYAPTLSIRKDVKLAKDTSQLTSMLHIELHLDYHYLLNIIHCASGRCVVDWNEDSQEMIFGLESSLDISVEASRSTLIYLSEAAPRLAGEAFWCFIFYPISALLSIFFNILRNPRHEYATHDMELLTLATKVIRSMPILRVTTHEIEYLRKMDAFVEELGRLSQAAITKAQNESA